MNSNRTFITWENILCDIVLWLMLHSTVKFVQNIHFCKAKFHRIQVCCNIRAHTMKL